jgi:ribosomal RNA assembly protein
LIHDKLLPSKVDLQLESGEYFLKSHEKQAQEDAKRKQKVRCSNICIKGHEFDLSTVIASHLPSILQQAEVATQRQAARSEAFVAPLEQAEPTIEEKMARKKRKAAHEESAGAAVDKDGESRPEKKKKQKNKNRQGSLMDED